MKPAERLVNSETTIFLSTAQGSDETETNFPTRLREAARYCKFETLKTSADLEAELTRLRFLAGLIDQEEKLKLLDPLRLNENLTVDELLQTLQYRSLAKKVCPI